MRQRGARAADVGEHVELERARPVVVVELPPARRARSADVVDEHVEAAEALARPPRRRPRRRAAVARSAAMPSAVLGAGRSSSRRDRARRARRRGRRRPRARPRARAPARSPDRCPPLPPVTRQPRPSSPRSTAASYRRAARRRIYSARRCRVCSSSATVRPRGTAEHRWQGQHDVPLTAAGTRRGAGAGRARRARRGPSRSTRPTSRARARRPR